ncbi:hypothetical protein AB205_0117870 [Aquarana catesbeiana]|uniref:Uncharacterized protein n=1 Tax=Aquarana catesbeiana TaxID=8400 RepID=A0A2G9S3A6_AQUCT|nr:hypothetical protein AB205_0117870 [Aquarana catesbeiana]
MNSLKNSILLFAKNQHHPLYLFVPALKNCQLNFPLRDNTRFGSWILKFTKGPKKG